MSVCCPWKHRSDSYTSAEHELVTPGPGKAKQQHNMQRVSKFTIGSELGMF
jgi:hypothetical protein